MIISVDEVKKHITTTLDDSVLEAKLQALELLVRGYTHNNFQKRSIRCMVDIFDGVCTADVAAPFKVGDTVQLSGNLNEGLYTITEADGLIMKVKEDVIKENDVLVTKIEYPADVKMGVVNMLKWDIENRDKVGIQSETISRHSVTYFNLDGDNSVMGYPKSLLGFLKPYKCARF